MSFHVPLLRAAATFAVTAIVSPALRAQDGTAAEVKALRERVEQQAKQIETLTAQVARLNAKLEGGGSPAPVAPPVTDGSEFSVPAARVVTPAVPANVHIVVKGESLDKIAKAHGTTAVELQKLNRITDPKKLQIGQQLMLPPSATKK